MSIVESSTIRWHSAYLFPTHGMCVMCVKWLLGSVTVSAPRKLAHTFHSSIYPMLIGNCSHHLSVHLSTHRHGRHRDSPVDDSCCSIIFLWNVRVCPHPVASSTRKTSSVFRVLGNVHGPTFFFPFRSDVTVLASLIGNSIGRRQV